MNTTYYVATRVAGDWYVSIDRASFERPESERSTWQGRDAFQAYPNVATVWQIDVKGVDGFRSTAEAIAAVLNAAAGVYTPHTVTQLYPTPPDEARRLDNARAQLRADYWSDVRGVVEDIKVEISRRNLTTEDDVTEYLDETCDGHARVIYTYQAIEGLLYTDNESAYADEFGEDGLVKDRAINWSALMYCALRQDVIDTLGDVEALLEEAKPDECEDCGEALPSDKCADCAAEPTCSICDAECSGHDKS